MQGLMDSEVTANPVTIDGKSEDTNSDELFA